MPPYFRPSADTSKYNFLSSILTPNDTFRSVCSFKESIYLASTAGNIFALNKFNQLSRSYVSPNTSAEPFTTIRANSTYVFACSAGGAGSTTTRIMRSSDGITWSERQQCIGPIAGFDCNNNGECLAVTSNSRWYYSTNNGDTFTLINPGFTFTNTTSFFVKYLTSAKLWCVSTAVVSPTGGQFWKNATLAGLVAGSATPINTAFPLNCWGEKDGKIWTGAGFYNDGTGFKYSTDNLNTFTTVQGPLYDSGSPGYILNNFIDYGGFLYALCANSIFRLESSGYWVRCPIGYSLSMGNIRDAAISYNDKLIVVGSTGANGAILSTLESEAL